VLRVDAGAPGETPPSNTSINREWALMSTHSCCLTPIGAYFIRLINLKCHIDFLAGRC